MRDRNDPVSRFEEDPPAQSVDDLAVRGEREALGGQRRAGHVSAQMLEPLALVGLDQDLGGSKPGMSRPSRSRPRDAKEFSRRPSSVPRPKTSLDAEALADFDRENPYP